jgi:predicted CXXCH cytochrome family protein
MGDLFNVYYEERLSEAESGSLEEEKIVTAGSSHPPYAEKNCQGCHDFKNKNLLLAPADELCEMCHVGFVDGKGKNIHGPVAVRDCLACHLPHSSLNKSLLKESLSGICATCHQEKRLALNMHNAVMEHKMECVNCHDAHGGDVTYFLK